MDRDGDGAVPEWPEPWPVRRRDLDRPDELRIDLDPQPGVTFDAVREVTLHVRDLLSEYELVGFPRTSGPRGMHVLVPIEAARRFGEVRCAAVAPARELERRWLELVTAAWWKEERGAHVFVDYNQNARDRTVASAYSVRPVPDARVSCPLEWQEVAGADPAALTMATFPRRLAAIRSPTSTALAHPSSPCSPSPASTSMRGCPMPHGPRTSQRERPSHRGHRRAGVPPRGARRLPGHGRWLPRRLVPSRQGPGRPVQRTCRTPARGTKQPSAARPPAHTPTLRTDRLAM